MNTSSPMVSADVDLTDFKFMPLEVARLRRSKAWLICKRRPELAFYMLNLWTASWHERPAGSLEDDDDVLADAAMCPPERWPEVKADALRGWIKCSDGRLYHPVVAEKVAESWYGKLMKRWQNECDRLRKENYRREKEGLEALPLPAKPAKVSVGVPPDVQGDAAGIPAESALKGRDREGKGRENLPQAMFRRKTARFAKPSMPGTKRRPVIRAGPRCRPSDLPDANPCRRVSVMPVA
jgi:hypothetical protein